MKIALALTLGAVLAAGSVQAALPAAPRDGRAAPSVIPVQGQPPAEAQRPVPQPSNAPPAGARQQQQEPPPLQGQPLGQYPPSGPNASVGGGVTAANEERAKELIGLPVESADGREIGAVTDLIVNINTGTVDRVIVGERRGVLNLSEVNYGIAWQHVRVDKQRGRVFVDLPAEQITAGPGMRNPPQ